MALFYNDTREFSPEALEELFLSVQWESGNHPERLAKALLHYGAVFSAWDGSRLAAAMDDGTMTAYVHYLLVHPRYQGCGVGSWLLGMCKRRYAGYLRIVLFLQGKGSFLRKEWFPSGPDAGGCAFDSSYVRRNRD